MSTPLRLVFMGSDAIARPLLEWLAGEGAAWAEIVAVFTQPDRPHGRGQRLAPNEIKQWAVARDLPVHQPERFDEAARAVLAGYRPDYTLVMAYGHILREAVIDTPRLGTVNLHTSILPAYRGASPIQTAVAMGERETGVTLMRIEPELDAGPIADAVRVAIGEFDTALDVESNLAQASARLVARNLSRLADETLDFVAQDATRATFCRRLRKEDGALDFAAPARGLAARINGLYPWPTCQVVIMDTPVKLGLARVGEGRSAARPGTVLAGSADALTLATGDGVLEVLRLQRPGGRMLAAADFLRGWEIAPGTVLPSRPMTMLTADHPLK
jgi:methionyl-tRNA formyltransferase